MRPCRLVPLIILLAFACSAAAQNLTPKERLGKLLFFDENLSARGNQSCATCHGSKVGWTGPDEHINKGGGVYEASIPGLFGNRKPPSTAYATQAPMLRLVQAARGIFVGGHFWDGRATGEKLGSAAADQALGPFLNPLEQALPDAKALVSKVCAGAYAALFKEVWGPTACDDVERAYGNIGLAIAAYEASSEVNAFSSKYDAYLAGKAELTAEERLGMTLFSGKGRCAGCHPSRRGPKGEPPLFTDFTYDNVGVPANPANPFYANLGANPEGKAWVDEGLGGFLAETEKHRAHAAANRGKHKVPTLRNVDLRPSPDFVKCFGHNGYFKSLEQIVHFYNTRLTLPVCGGANQKAGIDCWPAPEVRENINVIELGNLSLAPDEERAIVAFLRTLSDGYAAGK